MRFAMAVTAGVLASLINPWVLAGFAALYFLAKLSEGKVTKQALGSLFKRQEAAVTAFDEAVKQNRQAVENVTGLHNSAKALVTSAHRKPAIIQRRVTCFFGKAEPPPDARFPEASEEAVRDLPPESTPTPPTPNLPPPDCTTDDGKPGYLLAGTCYPLDTTELRLDGKEDIDFAKLAGFWRLTILDLDNAAITDLTPVANLTNLKILRLNGTQVSDLTPVAGLASLQELRLNRTYVSDLMPAASLSLRRLTVDGTRVNDLAPVAGFSSLLMLSLDNSLISDLSPIAGLFSLHGLDFDRTQVSDLTPAKRLTELRRLQLPDGRKLGGWQNNDENHREVQEFLATL